MVCIIVSVDVDDESPEHHRVISNNAYSTHNEAEADLPNVVAAAGYTALKEHKEDGTWEATDPDTGRRVRFWIRAI